MVKLIVTLLMMPFGMLIYGWAIMHNWNWFVAPLGVTELSLWHAYGLSIVPGLWQSSTFMRLTSIDGKKTTAELAGLSVGGWIGMAMSVGIGWIINHWLM